MKTPPAIHGSFSIERTFNAPVAQVFAAWTDVETKARWFIGPPDKWKVLSRELDLRVGGQETLRGELASGTTTTFIARYHAIVPNQRLVYAYDMYWGDKHLSVSLATVELSPIRSGTHMTFTEQAAFLDGEDGTQSREHGTAAHFERLAPVASDPHEVISARVLDAPRARVFRAFSDPEQLTRWWGPKGFTNTFHHFDPRPGGAWRFTMHGPDGTDYPNAKSFVEVLANERVVFDHIQDGHAFTMTMTFTELGAQTLLTWRMRFTSAESLAKSRAFIVEANEQNLDRLAAHLAG